MFHAKNAKYTKGRKGKIKVSIGMKYKLLFLIAICICYENTFAQPDTLWTRTYGGVYDDEGYCVQETFDSGYIILGSTIGPLNIWLIKTDINGDTLWTKKHGWDSSTTSGHYIQQTSDSGYIITGYTYSGSGNTDIFLIKTDKNGDTIWTRTYGNWEGFCVQETYDSGYIVVGWTWYNYAENIRLIRTDRNGDTLWTKIYGDSGFYEQGFCVQETYDSGYIIAGKKGDELSYNNYTFLMKTNKDGDTLWTKMLYDNSGGNFCSVQETFDKGYVIEGEEITSSGIVLIKTDSTGTGLFSKMFKIGGGTSYNSMQQTSDSGYIILGVNSTEGALLIKTDAGGNMVWNRNYGRGRGSFIRETSGGDYIVTGVIPDNNDDIWLLKVAKEEGVEETNQNSNLNTQISILPNPFVGTTVLSYQEAVNSEQKNNTRIYDGSGRLVEETEKTVIGKNLKAGVYFLKVSNYKPIKIIKLSSANKRE